MLCASDRDTWGRLARRIIGTGAAILLCSGSLGASAADAAPWDDGLRVSWVKDAGEAVVRMADPDVVVGVVQDPGGSLVQAAASTDGHRVWSTRLPPSARDARRHGPDETMTAGHGVVAVAGRAGLHVLDARSGQILWSAGPEPTRTGENDEPRVRIDAQAVHYSVPSGGVDEALLLSFDRLTGAERWRRTTRVGLSGGDGALVAGDSCAWEVLSPTTGAVRWAQERTVDDCPVPHGSGILTAGGLLAAPGTSTVLRDLDDGHPVTTLGDGTDTKVVAAGHGLWIAARGSDHVAYDDTGTELWRRPRPADPVYRRFGFHDGYVVATDQDARSWVSTVYGVKTTILDARTGAERSSGLTGAHVQTVAPGDGALVLNAFHRATAIVPGVRGSMVGPVHPTGLTSDPAVINSGVPVRTTARTVTVAPDIPTGQTAECRLDDGSWKPCSGPWQSPDLSTEGEHAVEVRTPGEPGMRHLFDVDRTGPTVEILRAPDPLTGPQAGSATVRFVASEVEATIECRIDGEPWDDCYGAEFPEGLRSGPHSMELRATDALGNRGPTATTTWIEDHTRPSVTFDPRPYPVDGYEAELPFSATDDRGVARVRCELREADAPTPLIVEDDCASPLKVAVPGMGDYRLTVVASDEAGNTATETKYVRFLATAVIDPKPEFAVSMSGPSADPSPYWGMSASLRSGRSWPLDFDITMECRVSRAGVAATGPWQECDDTGFVPGQRLPDADGRYVIAVRGTDEARRSGPTTEFGVGIDRRPPAAALPGGQTADARAGDSIRLPAMDVVASGPDESPIASARCEVFVRWVLDPTRTCGSTTTMPSHHVDVEAIVKDTAGNVTRVSRTIGVAPGTGGDPGPSDPPDGGGTTTPDPTGGGPGTPSDPEDGAGPTPQQPQAPGDGTPRVDATPPLGGLQPPTWPLEPVVPRPGGPSTTPPVPTGPCSPSRARGRAPVGVSTAVRRSGRVVVTARVPGATAGRPVRLTLQGRSRCGPWRTIGRASASAPRVRLSVAATGAVDAVRWRSVRRGRIAVGASRPLR